MPFSWGPPLSQWSRQQWQIFSLIFLVYGAKTYRRTRGVLDNFVQGKGAGRRTKELLLPYFIEGSLIQFTWSVSVRDWTKLEGLSRVMMNKTSCWWMVGSKRGWPWSKKARCYSRQVSSDGCLQSMVSVTEEYISRFCLSCSSWTTVEASEGYSVYMSNTSMFLRVLELHMEVQISSKD